MALTADSRILGRDRQRFEALGKANRHRLSAAAEKQRLASLPRAVAIDRVCVLVQQPRRDLAHVKLRSLLLKLRGSGAIAVDELLSYLGLDSPGLRLGDLTPAERRLLAFVLQGAKGSGSRLVPRKATKYPGRSGTACPCGRRTTQPRLRHTNGVAHGGRPRTFVGLTADYSRMLISLTSAARAHRVPPLVARVALALHERGGEATTTELQRDLLLQEPALRAALGFMYAGRLALGRAVDGGRRRPGIGVRVQLTTAGRRVARLVIAHDARRVTLA